MTTLVLRFGPDSGTDRDWEGPTPSHVPGPDASTPPASDDDVYMRNDTDSTEAIVYYDHLGRFADVGAELPPDFIALPKPSA